MKPGGIHIDAFLRIGLALALLAGLFAAMPVMPAQAADANLRGYWALDGNANDSSGYGYTGTLTGGGWSAEHAPTAFANTGSLALDGSSGQGIQAPLVTAATNNVSMSAWVRWGGITGNYQSIIYNGNSGPNGYGIFADPGGILVILNGGIGFAMSTTALTPGVWQYLVAMRDAGTWKLYLDGTQVALTGNPAPNVPAEYTTIGRAVVNTNNTFNGLIDDARIYDRVLIPAEICSPAITVTNANDAGPGSLRAAIAGLCGGGTITFASDLTILLSSELAVNKNLTITGTDHAVTIDGNHATRVFNITAGTVTLNRLTVANGYVNHGGDYGNAKGGGGIYLSGANLIVNESTFTGNAANWPGGGGIQAWTDSTLTVTHSAFLNNQAFEGGYGGGISTFYNTALTVANSTFSGNSANSAGGALSVTGTGNILNTTIAGNSSAWSGGGGGINNEAGTVTVINSILANNPTGGNCFNHYDTPFSGSTSLADDSSCAGVAISSAIRLGALGNYGGSTQTIPLLYGSAAINAGDDAVCAAAPVSGRDQRGVARPQDAHCEIGAYEAAFILVTATNQEMTYGDSQPVYDFTLEPPDAVFSTPPTCGAGTLIGAGTYSIICSGGVAADPKYTVVYQDAALIVHKADSSITVTGPTTFTYNGSPQGPNTALVTGSTGAVTYTYTGTGTTVYGPSLIRPTAVGTYSVVASVAADDNYNAASSTPTGFTMNKANSSITVTGSTAFFYNGSPQGPDTAFVTGSTGAVTFAYAGTGTTVYGPSPAKPTGTGAYTVTAAVAADDHYNAASSGPTAFVISLSAPVAATQPATAVGKSGATLNGSVNAKYNSITVTFEYGRTDGYGSTVTAAQSPLSGGENTPVSAVITGLTPNVTYHFRVVVVYADGTVYGQDRTFTTEAFQTFLPLLRYR